MPTRHLQLALAALWTVDALLQLQPANFGAQLVYGTILSNAMHQPRLIVASLVDATRLLAPYHVALNAAIAAIELGIAAALLWRRSVRWALGASILWALGVWWLGEGFGGLFAGQATLLVGAPGAAALYALLALVAWPVGRDRQTDARAGAPAAAGSPAANQVPAPARAPAGAGALGERRTLACWSALWIGGAILRVVPFWFGPVYALRADLTTGLDEEPRWMLQIGVHLSALAGDAGLPLVIALAAVEAAVGILALTSHRRVALAVGAVLSAIYWAVGQQFGGVLTGSATDVGAGPLYLLLAWSLWQPRPQSRLRGRAPWRKRSRRPDGIIRLWQPHAPAFRRLGLSASATPRWPRRWPQAQGGSCASCAARR